MKHEITAKRLQLALSNANMIPQELADKSGVSKASISQYMNGSHAPSNISSGKIGKILKVNPLWLMGFDVEMETDLKDENESMSDTDKKLLYNFRNKLDEQGRTTVLQIIDNEIKRVESIRQLENKIKSFELSSELIPTRIISYCQRLASAGSGEYLFDDVPTDVIKVEDTPEARKADFVIGVNGDSMEPDYYDGEKVFVKKTPDIETGEVGVFVRGTECYIKECGRDGLISKNSKYADVEPFSDGIKVVGKVIGKAILVNK